MSRYTYAGNFQNPTDGMFIVHHEDGTVRIALPVHCECGNECCSRPIIGFRLHTSAPTFSGEDAESDAYDYLESLASLFEEDYDDYLEENRYTIVQMERYELWRNEY